MKSIEKYIETLKTFTDYVTVSEWANKVVELYPELLKKAEKNVDNHKHNTTAFQQVTRQISSEITRGKFNEFIHIDDNERPRKVKYITKDELIIQEQIEIDEDIEPLRRLDIINNATNQLEIFELYRITEFENIQKAFKQFFGLDFEIDHAEALLNSEKQGEHHPNNLQLLLKYHNGKKNKNSWNRFTFEEQEDYIKKSVSLHSLVADKFDVEIDNKILDSLLNRLREIY